MSGDSYSNDQQISSEGNFENFKEEHNSNGNAAGDIDDDMADDSKKIFVGGLSWETTEKDLKDYFNKIGEVKTCTIKVDKFTNQSRGFGFVIFTEEDTVSKVLEVKEHRLNNKKIDPKRAKPSREPMKKIFVGGIDPEISEEKVKEYFGQFGKIESLDLPFDNLKGKRKSYIFVTYASEGEAKKATEKEKQEIFGRSCDVRIAVPREQANRQRGYPQYGGYGGGNGGYAGYGGYDPYGYCQPGYGDYYGYGQGYPGYGYDYSGYGGEAAYSGGAAGFGARGGGKMRGGRGGGGGTAPATTGTGTGPAGQQSFHPYNRQ